MKILGEKSLSSKVELGLEILFLVIALIDIAAIGVLGIVTISELSRYQIMGTQFFNAIYTILTMVTFIFTGIIAIYIIYQFIKIFRNLKESKLFDEENSKCLSKISKTSIIMSVLYFIIFIGLARFSRILLNDIANRFLCMILVLTFFTAFLIFGIGIKILNEIYKKAIQYKNENDLTI